MKEDLWMYCPYWRIRKEPRVQSASQLDWVQTPCAQSATCLRLANRLDPPGVYTLVSLGVNAVVCINSDDCLQFSSCSKLRYNIVQQISIVRAMKQAP